MRGNDANDVVLFTGRERVEVARQPIPEPRPDEVLVRTRSSLISIGTELTVLSGNTPPGSEWDRLTKYPFTPGYCNIGEVVAVGTEVTTLQAGERVGTWGDHARFTTAKASHCRPVPPEIPDDEACFFTLAEIVMNGVRRSRLTWGETVVVFGLGLLGQLVVRVCLAAGAQRVYGVDISEARAGLLPSARRVERVLAADTSPREVVRAATGGSMADVAFEVTGRPEAIPEQVKVLRNQGRYLILSSPTGPTTFDFHDWCNYRSLEIIGAHNFSHPTVATPQAPWTMHRHSELFFEFLRTGAMEVGSLITHRVPYGDAPEIYLSLLRDRSAAMGVVFEW